MTTLNWKQGEAIESNTINSYHSRRNVWWLKNDKELELRKAPGVGHEAFNYIGCELELNFPTVREYNANKNMWHKAFAASLFKNMRSKDGSPLFFTEYDSNIPDGFEIITQPATALYWFDKYFKYLEAGLAVINSHGARGGYGIPGGLHFHCSAHNFTPEIIAKIILAVNNPRWRKALIKYGRRDMQTLSKYCRFIDVRKVFNITQKMRVRKLIDIVANNLSVLTDKTATLNFGDGHTHYANKYLAVNIMSTAKENPLDRTVEFRMFKNTTDINQIRGCFAITCALINFACCNNITFTDYYYHKTFEELVSEFALCDGIDEYLADVNARYVDNLTGIEDEIYHNKYIDNKINW